MIVSISKGYQMTIPSDVRKEFGLVIGSRLELEKKKKQIILKPLEKASLKDLLRESKKFKKHSLTPEDLEKMEKDIND